MYFLRGLNYYTWENEDKLVEKTEVRGHKVAETFIVAIRLLIFNVYFSTF